MVKKKGDSKRVIRTMVPREHVGNSIEGNKSNVKMIGFLT